MDKKAIPKGVDDFKEIITENYYYVDKSLLIEDLRRNKFKAFLITRPRRFGKTLNMSMLKYFFDIKGKEGNRELFSGLKIENTKYIEEFGKYPVIFLSMKDVKGKDFNEMFKIFRGKIRKIFNEFVEIRESLNESDRLVFDSIWLLQEGGNYWIALQDLSGFIERYYGVKPVVLIDEYDAPYIFSKDGGYLEEAKVLLSNFYSSILKEGGYSFAVVTGILKIVKESIFSGLNNLDVSTILDDTYNYFGMSEDEVESILSYYNLETTMDETRAWYNGYIFGGKTVYNPWSIINHCIKGELKAFWVNTSANLLIVDLIRNSDSDVYDSLYKLLEEKEVEITVKKNMVLDNYFGSNALFTLMLYAGYLTIVREVEENEYIVKIPNKEVKSVFRESFIELAEPSAGDNFKMLIKALKSGNIKGKNSVEEAISNLLEKYLSYHDTSKYEIFYHNLLLGIMSSFEGDYNVSSNVESGHGRYDLAMISKKNNMPSYLFEFKVAKSESVMDKQGEDALTQIKERKYSSKLPKDRNINEIAVIFFKKKLKLYQDKE